MNLWSIQVSDTRTVQRALETLQSNNAASHAEVLRVMLRTKSEFAEGFSELRTRMDAMTTQPGGAVAGQVAPATVASPVAAPESEAGLLTFNQMKSLLDFGKRVCGIHVCSPCETAPASMWDGLCMSLIVSSRAHSSHRVPISYRVGARSTLCFPEWMFNMSMGAPLCQLSD